MERSASSTDLSWRTWLSAPLETSVIDDAICTYAGEPYAFPDHPGVTGSTISGIIPTTAFANWRLGERRFTVSVVAAIDGDPESAAEAEALAGAIAALELEAAQTAP